jgi:hypothetical protein
MAASEPVVCAAACGLVALALPLSRLARPEAGSV